MKSDIQICFISLVGLFTTACSSYDFNQEQYKNEVNLLSNSAMIYDRQIAQMSNKGDTLFLVAGLSGTNAANKPFDVGLVEADSLFKAYNKSNFDIETERYARWLPKACYTIPSMQQQIPAGQFKVDFPIYLKNLHKLSPDSIYFLNYKIDPSKTTAYNPKKKEVLIRIYMQNEFATTKAATFYNYTSSYVTLLDNPNNVPKRPTNANRVFPLSENSVRMLAGDESFGDYKKALKHINSKSITVTVGKQTPQNPDARFVTISPYKTIEVEQLPPLGLYDNTYLINVISTPDGRKTYYKEFRLHYKYRLTQTSTYKEVKAVLRLEYNPRNELL